MPCLRERPAASHLESVCGLTRLAVIDRHGPASRLHRRRRAHPDRLVPRVAVVGRRAAPRRRRDRGRAQAREAPARRRRRGLLRQRPLRGHRPGARAPGRDLRQDPEHGPRDDRQQGLRLGPPGGRARREDRRPRRSGSRRRRRDGVDVERPVLHAGRSQRRPDGQHHPHRRDDPRRPLGPVLERPHGRAAARPARRSTNSRARPKTSSRRRASAARSRPRKRACSPPRSSR